MDKESIIYDTATISDIPKLVRLRILYMIDDFGSLTDEERESMEKQLPGYFERELGKKQSRLSQEQRAGVFLQHTC